MLKHSLIHSRQWINSLQLNSADDKWACKRVKLTDEERVYLNAAALGDVPIVRQSLGDTTSNNDTLNVNCVDYMGRSALHLAVDSESMETVELLLDRVNFECFEESLLHAISKGATKIVKVMPMSYIACQQVMRSAPFLLPVIKSAPFISLILLDTVHYTKLSTCVGEISLT